MKNVNLFEKMDNLKKRYMHGDVYGDVEIDKNYIQKNGCGTYYFIARPIGSVCASKEHYDSNYSNAREVLDYYQNEEKWASNNKNTFYVIKVNEIINRTPYGTIKKVKTFK